MPVVCGGNENAKCSVRFRMVKQEMWDKCLFGPVCDFGDNIFPCFSVLPHWGTWDSSPVSGWRGWHCLCWPTDLHSSLVNQASEKIPVGKIIFHKGKVSLSAAHFSNLVFCGAELDWAVSVKGQLPGVKAGSCAGQMCRRALGLGEDGCAWPTWCEACLERLQMEQLHDHLTHICWASVICWLQCHMDGKCAKREKSFSFGMFKKIKECCIFNFQKGWRVFHWWKMIFCIPSFCASPVPCCPLLIPPSLLFPLPHNSSQELSASDQFCSSCTLVSLLNPLKRRSYL